MSLQNIRSTSPLFKAVIIDAEGHIEDAPISAALAGLKQICEDIRFLGSYPQAK
jgi:prephenate dehydratase